ncbi:MAG TPA: A24 family peptidase [Polyangia bacterium]|nr:A24 family peptidase [Polyangia bacterium]
MALSIGWLGPLGLGLAVAIVCDLRARRIPNVVSITLLAAAVVVRGLHQGGLAAVSGVGAAALVVAALYRPWLMGGIGGGDVKLAAATAAWVPFGRLHWFALCAAAAGGVVAVVYYFVARPGARAEIRANLTLTVLHNELPSVPSHRAGHPSVPYALAIAAGAAVALLAP